MIGGKGHCTVCNRYSLNGIAAVLINDRYLAGGIKAIVFIQRNLYGRIIPLGISLRINVIRSISGILACIKRYSFLGSSQTRQSCRGNRHIALGYGYRRCNSCQSNSLGAFIYGGVGAISAFILIAVGYAFAFKIVHSAVAVTRNNNLVAVNLKCGHRKCVVSSVMILIIAYKAGVQI